MLCRINSTVKTVQEQQETAFSLFRAEICLEKTTANDAMGNCICRSMLCRIIGSVAQPKQYSDSDQLNSSLLVSQEQLLRDESINRREHLHLLPLNALQVSGKPGQQRQGNTGTTASF
jgi:hypothetical protein